MKTCLLCSWDATDDAATCQMCGEATFSEVVPDNAVAVTDEPALQLVETSKPKPKRK